MMLSGSFLILLLYSLNTVTAFHCYSCNEAENSTDYKICLDGVVDRLLKIYCEDYFTSCAVLYSQDQGEYPFFFRALIQ